MNTELLVLFIACNIVNVIIQTIKSLVTIKGGAISASLVNAIAYGFYTYIIIITSYDIPTWQKMLIVALCNLVGVFSVKKVEEKKTKEKLYKIEATIKSKRKEFMEEQLRSFGISFNYISLGDCIVFNCYCKNKQQSKNCKKILEESNAKYFVSESKIL